MRGDLDSGSPLRGEPEMTPDAPALKRCLIDLPVRAHEPMLICERLASEPLGHPIRDQDRRERPEIGGRHVADRVPRFLVDHHLLWPLDRFDEPLGMLDGAEFLAFAGNDEERYADFIGVAFPGDGITEAVELVLLSDPPPVHEPLLERR